MFFSPMFFHTLHHPYTHISEVREFLESTGRSMKEANEAWQPFKQATKGCNFEPHLFEAARPGSKLKG